jgi:hypothetical protein
LTAGREEARVRTTVRVGGFAALLAVVLAAGWTAGAAVRTAPRQAAALVPGTTQLAPGVPGDYAFGLTGAVAGAPALTVVRADGAVLVRGTPVPGPDGRWHAPLTLPVAGPYRALVQVGAGPTLAADLLAPGPYDPLPATPSRVAEVDGYQVRLDGDLGPGPTQVFATVSRDGAPVGDLEPVGGAFGRLEALRVDDLAPARVHPDAAPPAPSDRAGPGIAFTAEVPGAGTYRLFLDFRHAGVLHTAVFTLLSG